MATGIGIDGARPRRAALVVGHPGHELRVHHWIERTRPRAFVLTDGSGRTARSRLPSTTKVLEAAGAEADAAVYGAFTDAEVYDAIRQGDVAPFAAVARTLADALIAHHIDTVAADALEGFNPSHDLCRYLVNAAVSLVRQRTDRVLANLDFLLDGPPDERADDRRGGAIALHLDADALRRKLAAARGYPELRDETDAAIARFGERAFAVEVLRPVSDLRQGVDALGTAPPYYEEFGERQVRAGHYASVIRYAAHVRPFVHALWHQLGLAASPTTISASAATGVSS